MHHSEIKKIRLRLLYMRCINMIDNIFLGLNKNKTMKCIHSHFKSLIKDKTIVQQNIWKLIIKLQADCKNMAFPFIYTYWEFGWYEFLFLDWIQKPSREWIFVNVKLEKAIQIPLQTEVVKWKYIDWTK